MRFVRIQGRAKRFAKIAGEMVSLTTVELLTKSCWPDHDHAVIARPDSKKGEKLLLFTTHSEADYRHLLTIAREQGITELAVPKDIIPVDSIPLLGTGKIDYNALADNE
jgi:acyl-[acyl-carrier-protein]-phospholipid O-acyltransferase/long-chain-fatty-acid--[acyl-carrier-protein] ligase